MRKIEWKALTSARESPAEVDKVKKYDTVVSSGQSALRALLTMNGGAIIVFITFIGHLLNNKGTIPQQSMRIFVTALLYFIAGIFFALLAYSAIFVTNCFSSVNWHKSSNGAFAVTLLCGFGSLAGFLAGSWRAVEAFQSLTPRLSP